MVKNKAPKAAPMVYVGPSIRGVVRQYTTFTNGLPKDLDKKAEEIPAIRGLIVPVNQLPKAMADIRNREGLCYALYKKVQSKI